MLRCSSLLSCSPDYHSPIFSLLSTQVVGSEHPSLFLAVRGFNLLHVSDAQIGELFRQYAVVKSVVVMKDPGTNYSRGLAYVEFYSVEQAAYALQNTAA